ncbi:MAG: hypothetical protein HY465_01440, partial [Deltaproteobacteria bacterium]|nr:hypothetical protein [Deltaproteobacteria bacterium]
MKRFLLMGLACCFLLSCGGRLPPRHRAERLLQHYFERYAKKYPTTAFGQHPVKKVEV